MLALVLGEWPSAMTEVTCKPYFKFTLIFSVGVRPDQKSLKFTRSDYGSWMVYANGKPSM